MLLRREQTEESIQHFESTRKKKKDYEDAHNRGWMRGNVLCNGKVYNGSLAARGTFAACQKSKLSCIQYYLRQAVL